MKVALPEVEIRALASSTYTRETVERALAALWDRKDTEASEQREFLAGLMNLHGW